MNPNKRKMMTDENKLIKVTDKINQNITYTSGIQ